MSTTIFKYKIYCATDDTYEYVFSQTEPSTCPTNTSHTIIPEKTVVVDTIDSTSVSVKEESTQTGGNFGCTTLNVTSNAHSIDSISVSWPFPISALCVQFVSTESHRGSFIDMSVGKNTIIGYLTSNISPATSWSSQNYSLGDKVIFTDTIGSRVYTCIKDTVSNESPTNKIYWILGYELSVSSTVVNITYIGYYIKLFDGVNNDDVGRVLFKNISTNKIYVELNPSHSFSASSPTYIRQSVYILKNYEIQEPWEHNIGQSKIGGAYIPADISITIDFTNNSDSSQTILGRVEYLY